MQRFLALREIATYLKSGLDSVGSAISALSLSASQTNQINISGGGQTIVNKTMLDGQSILLFSGIERIAGTLFAKRLSDGLVSSIGFNATSGNLVNSSDVLLSLTGGDLNLSVTDDLEIYIYFNSIPLMGGGIVGPIGPAGGTPYIGGNSNWWVSGLDTGVAATGPAGTELSIGSWTNLSYGSGWSDFHVNYYSGQYRIFHDTVQMRGFIQSADWYAQPNIATLPAEARPERRLSALVPGYNEGECRIILFTDGILKVQSGGAGSSWISLDNIQFSLFL